MNFNSKLDTSEMLMLNEFEVIKLSQPFQNHLANLNIEPEDVDTTKAEARVKWYINYETRDWGIACIDHIIESIRIVIDWELWEDRSVYGSVDINIENAVDGWQITDSMKSTDSGQLTCNNIEIDFKNKKVEVS